MNSKVLLEMLRELEVALHQPEVRGDPVKLNRLLHPRFREFGRSGRIYTRADIVAEFSGPPQTYAVWSQEFQVEPLSESLSYGSSRGLHCCSSLDSSRSSLDSLCGNGEQNKPHSMSLGKEFPCSSATLSF